MPSLTTTLLSLFTTLTTALPTPSTAPTYPPFSNAANYILVANVTDPSCDLSPSINNYQLTGFHTGAGTAIAVLEAPTADSNPGRTFYTNGTATDIRYGTGNVLSEGGTPPFPEGFDVPAANETDSKGRRAVTVDAGSGTEGVRVSTFPEMVVRLEYMQGGFYACNTTLLYPPGPAVVVYYAGADEAVPEGCVGINLLPQCVVNGTEHTTAENSDCYADVAGIDWSMYSE